MLSIFISTLVIVLLNSFILCLYMGDKITMGIKYIITFVAVTHYSVDMVTYILEWTRNLQYFSRRVWKKLVYLYCVFVGYLEVTRSARLNFSY